MAAGGQRQTRAQPAACNGTTGRPLCPEAVHVSQVHLPTFTAFGPESCDAACSSKLLQEERVSEEQDVVAAFFHLADGLLRAAPGMLLPSEQLPPLVAWAGASLRVRSLTACSLPGRACALCVPWHVDLLPLLHPGYSFFLLEYHVHCGAAACRFGKRRLCRRRWSY